MTPLQQANFELFYNLYLREHSMPLTRGLHILGFIIFIEGCGRGIFLSPLWFVWAVVGNRLVSWFSHFFIEKNKPLSFTNPLWTIKAGQRMYYEILIGKIPWVKI